MATNDIFDRYQVFENCRDPGHLVEHFFGRIAEARIEPLEVDKHRYRDVGEIGGVVSGATVTEIGVDPRPKRIVAGSTEETVLASAANQQVVAGAAPQEIVAITTGQFVIVVAAR